MLTTNKCCFFKVRYLGSGSYGVVYECKRSNKPTGKHVAVKVISRVECVQGSDIDEVALMQQLKHKNILKLIDWKQTPEHIFMVLELFPISLDMYMNNIKSPMNPRLALSYTKQILKGLAHIHALNIIHRDIKPANMLINKKGDVVIADFGISTKIRNEYAITANTLMYRPPEVLLSFSYDQSVDIWAVGCMLAEMLTRNIIFESTSRKECLEAISNLLGMPNYKNLHALLNDDQHSYQTKKRIWPDMNLNIENFILQCLAWSPNNRPTAAKLIKHSIFKEFHI
jgi:serine/threonine protein kinase